MKSFRYGEKGFTLIELVIIAAILGIIASVILPNVEVFLITGNLAAAKAEAAAVITAGRASYVDNSEWPDDSLTLYPDYLDRAPEAKYTFDSTNGTIDVDSGDEGKWGELGFTFVSANQTWTQ